MVDDFTSHGSWHAIEAAAINAACGANLSGCLALAAEGTVGLANEGPDGFYLFTRSQAVPEPAALAMLGAALPGFGLSRRRRKNV
jgi:hypothetical protein